MIPVLRDLHRILRVDVARGADLYTDALDLLAITQIAGAGRQIRYRFEVRDLHDLQFRRGVPAIGIRLVERLLLPRVYQLVLTSDAFWTHYYARFGPRRHIVVENTPDREIWHAFRRRNREGAFLIGFVGIIRYLPCLESLIEAVRILRKEGRDIRIRFAGGGEVDRLRQFCGGDDFVEFTGPFRYALEAPALYADLDLIYSVYDTRSPNVRVAMPNKFYEALITRIPILVASGTYLADRVTEAGIGAAVAPLDPVEIASTLRTAHERSGWYASASARLHEDLAGRYFDEHEKAMGKAILG